ncbi:fasciclin domain-containing protein [Microvirga sp. SRT04]|uniref:Fasciclin domain-containing protein n=2 Tax=Hymenobacter properus TaxID=2791026 RepID=A0A931FHB7_9BACT|nr:fasciclin domain-containing protein [Hymenobacter properus]MBR7719701.1 fasciclin domain-containing protein [Microvirga sp. SRT04]
MNTKPFFAAAALLAALATPAFAQDMKTKADDEKTKTKADGMTTKTKMADDGKMKVKGKSDAGDKMKAKTMPRKGEAMGTSTSTTTTTSSMSTTSTMSSGGGVMVGGAMMTPDKDIVDNAVGSSDHTTLVAAVKAAGLVETLKSAGPFTVFAPTNAAFDKLPAGTVNSLVQPENKSKLTTILTYHVVPGRYTAGNLTPGQVLTTVEGETLTVMKNGNGVMIKDAKGGMARVTIPDVISSNGVTHVIDTVLMPTK